MFLLQALGSNGSGQLGLGHKEDVDTPQPVILPAPLSRNSTPHTEHDIRPIRIAAGGNHTLLLLSSGDLLWTGDASTGACGPASPPSDHVGEPTPSFRPVDLTSPPLPPSGRFKIRHIAATWSASIVVLTSDDDDDNDDSSEEGEDRVYAFGSGAKGELGLGQGTLRTSEPMPIPDFPPRGARVVDLAACMGHVVAVLSNGEAWGWGNGRKGQLGEPAMGAVWSPRRIGIEGGGAGTQFKVVKAVCGREFTCLFGHPETGEMIVLGSDKWGVRSEAPDKGSLAGWREVGAGWGSVYVLKEDGRLLGWGRDDHGQLARSEDLGRVTQMAVGSEHALAWTESGDLMAWGWGEHGNCGPVRSDDGKKGQHNRIVSGGLGLEITMLGAGCATSWIAIKKPR
ncbi:regulator of chromosome condensation 1/beta-lactamase-inhibitor protein II [Chaetomium strumarium]|uniref:Regulator of chromosome condensation 1/beta-lactamase-inhibitor protein II n=1 Tax=Chaetomium strumarium TaxID=1170767 RepID=A0AAJ0GLR2_9PEZI|nr:regulator of chromosome condensation 1/beta-lactamase-inhibitor protein II [Chaetomium strumarium]